MTITCQDRTMNISLSGEIDHHAAGQVIKEMGEAVDTYLPARCIVDMGNVSFMDSSGIAVILGAYRRLREIGADIEVTHVPRQASRVLTAAGVDRIVPLKRA